MFCKRENKEAQGVKGLPWAGELGLSLSVWPLHHHLMNSFHDESRGTVGWILHPDNPSASVIKPASPAVHRPL